MKLLYGVILLIALSVPSLAAAPPAQSEVPGLTVTAPQTVKYDEGFVTLKADCKGPVKWLVLSTSTKLKFKVSPQSPNEIDVAIPPYQSEITVFCIGVVDGKQTDFARTDVAVDGPPPPAANGGPPTDVKTPLHISIIIDPARRTDAIKGIIENPGLFAKLREKKIKPRVYSITDAVLKAKGFDAVLKKYGAPVLIMQDDSGKALIMGRLPKDSAELLKLIGPFVGGS